MAERGFNEFGKNHHNEFYADLQTVQVQMNGNVRISLYSNAEGTVYANDNMGNPINNRLLKYTMYTNPYFHKFDGNIPGALTIHFLDGTFYKKTDDEDPVNPVCWYSFLDLVPLTVKPLT
uniref:Uncharacterized protein n=1 Tax=viral metagenome TaxID=1070528 RepID=A0A6C0KIR7_9ZZZZ